MKRTRYTFILLFFILLIPFGEASAQSSWKSLKEKAKAAWNSDERKEAWEKTKEAWNSDERKEAWRKTKETAKKAWNSDTRKKAWSKTKEMTESMTAECSYTVPLTDRSFIDVIPDEQLFSLSSQQYNRMLRNSTLSTDAAKKARVSRVAKRLIKAVTDFYEEQGREDELEGYQWEFNLIKSRTVNASCMPGGKILVYDGIMSVANSDASLAIVLGHEIGHAIAKHAAEQMTKGIVTTVGISAVYIMVNTSDMSSRKKLLAKMMASAGASLASLKFSRIDETEADHIGLILAAMAGYNPEAAVPFWKRMGKATGNTGKHDWYSTHPSNSNRIENIRGFMDEAKEYYKGK